jgi:putative peptidoglycan lipid II flippase
LLYERGEFTPGQTPVVAAALAAFSTGLAFNGMMLMLNRAFFALQSPWIPTWVAAFNLTLNTLLYIPLYRVGTWGIPLAISLSNVAAALVLLVLLRRRLRRLEIRETARAVALVTLASLVLAGVSYGVWWALDNGLGDEFVAQVVAVGVALAAGGAAYLGACWVLRVRELRALLALIRSRPGS